MSSPFVAEIRIFPFNFAPRGWAFCDGQLISISQNTALFSLLGTFYGGDGRTTFGLPNLQGMSPLHSGQGPGLSLYDIGQTGGTPTVTLLQSEIPNHGHTVMAHGTPPPGNAGTPAPSVVLARSSGGTAYTTPANLVTMSPNLIGVAGSGNPHNNMMPYLTLSFCIAMQGIFPARS